MGMLRILLDSHSVIGNADIAHIQVLLSPWAGVFAKDKPKAVQEWQDRIFARPAVQKGLVSLALFARDGQC